MSRKGDHSPYPDRDAALEAGVLTRRQVAMILGITPNAVLEAEWRALRKLVRHPKLRGLAKEMGLVPEMEEGP